MQKEVQKRFITRDLDDNFIIIIHDISYVKFVVSVRYLQHALIESVLVYVYSDILAVDILYM